MWLGALVQMVTLSWAAVGAAADAATAPETLPSAVFTRQTDFSIPFRIDPAAPGARELVEVQLYVSTDRGASWQFHGRAELDRRQFVFHADKEGEYWFLIRTLNRSGQLLPRVPKPGLRVVVDTTPPKLELSAKQGEGGRVSVQWQVQERNHVPETLKLQCRTGADQPWQSVVVSRGATPAAGSVHRGEATWWPPAGAERVEIRGEALDSAGNVGVGHAQVTAARPAATAAKEPPTNRPAANLNWAPPNAGPSSAWESAVSPPSIPWRSDRSEIESRANGSLGHSAAPPTAAATASASPNPNSAPATVPQGRMAASPTPMGATAGVAATPVSNPGVAQPASPGSSAAAGSTPTPGPGPVSAPGPGLAPTPDAIAGSPTAPASTTASPVDGMVAIQVQPPVASRHVLAKPKSEGKFVGLPAGQQAQWVNSRRFQLEYDIDAIGPSGVSQVELWGTRDGGKIWTSFGLDNDKRSPFVVSVDEEGMYGFRIAVQSGAGLGGDPPSSGAPADVWIGVDLSKPECCIVSTEPKTGESAGQLLIRWEAADVALATQPVSLFFSQFRDGPWTPIASGLDPTGQYEWAKPAQGPMQVYLRLEARDQAGNLGIYETPEPVTLDRARPSVRIREIRPLLPGRR